MRCLFTSCNGCGTNPQSTQAKAMDSALGRRPRGAAEDPLVQTDHPVPQKNQKKQYTQTQKNQLSQGRNTLFLSRRGMKVGASNHPSEMLRLCIRIEQPDLIQMTKNLTCVQPFSSYCTAVELSVQLDLVWLLWRHSAVCRWEQLCCFLWG